MESSEPALGVAKPLMASNDTLFNLEDTFGDDPFSPRAQSQNDLHVLSPLPPPQINADKPKDNESENSDELHQNTLMSDRPKMELNFESTKKFRSFELLTDDAELCSPDQAKTFSEDINLTEQKSSDLSVTVDQDGTFTTIEEKTCITVDGDNTYVKEDIISQTSEPEWEVTISSAQKQIDDNNSLVGIESLDVIQLEDAVLDVTTELNNIVPIDNNEDKPDDDSTHENESEKLDVVEPKSESDEKCFDFLSTTQKDVDKDKDEGISSKEESCNETENSINDENDDNTRCKSPVDTVKSNRNYHDDSSNKENSMGSNKTSNALINNSSSNQASRLPSNPNILDFLNKEIEYASNQFYHGTNRSDVNSSQPDSGNSDSGADMYTDLDSNENVQIEQSDSVIRGNNLNKGSYVYKLPTNTNNSQILVQDNSEFLIEFDGKSLLSNGNNIDKFVSISLIFILSCF